MALFSRNEGGREDEFLAADVATRALSVTAVETDFVAGVYEKLASVYDYHRSARRCTRAGCRRCSGWPSPAGDRDARGGRRHGDQPGAVSPRLHGHRHRPVGLDAGEGATSVWRRTGCATSASCRWTPRPSTFADDSFDIVYAPYLVSVVPDPVAVVSRNATGVPAGRPHHHPESLPEREPAALVGRAPDLAVHGPRRLQVGPRPAGVPRAGRA